MLSLPAPYFLRPMTVADIPAVMAIDGRSFPTPTQEQMFINELVENRLAHYQVLVRGKASEEIGATHFPKWVAPGEPPEVIVGFAGFWLIAGEIHVSTIAVDPAERGRGRGEWLLLNLLLEACQLDPLLMTLEVRQSNVVAQNLYRKYRFEEVGLRRRYYHDTGEDALLMTVDLATVPDYCAWLGERAALVGTRPTAD